MSTGLARTGRGRPRRGNLLMGGLILCFVGPLTCSGVHDVELRCEEAAAHLAGCCPDFDPAALDCRYQAACGNVNGRPDLPLEQSACILDRSCEALQAGGAGSVCARVKKTMTGAGTTVYCP